MRIVLDTNILVRANAKASGPARELLEIVATSANHKMIFPGPAPRVVLSDPDDDPVVHTAVIGQAHALCTLTRHFYNPAVRDYCRDRGVLIASDVDILNLLREK